MELRGGGELTGQRQHGKGSLQVSNLVRDVDVLLETREMLERMPEEFPEDYAKATQLALEKIREGEDVYKRQGRSRARPFARRRIR